MPYADAQVNVPPPPDYNGKPTLGMCVYDFAGLPPQGTGTMQIMIPQNEDCDNDQELWIYRDGNLDRTELPDVPWTEDNLTYEVRHGKCGSSSSISSISSSDYSSEEPEPACGDVCIQAGYWINGKFQVEDSFEISGAWVPADDPLLDELPDLPRIAFGTTAYVGYCQYIFSYDGRVFAFYQGWLPESGGIASQPDYTFHLYHDDIYQGQYGQNIPITGFGQFDYRIKNGACEESSSSSISSSNESDEPCDCDEFCLKSTDLATGKVTYSSAMGLWGSIDEGGFPPDLVEQFENADTLPVGQELAGFCVYTFLGVYQNGTDDNIITIFEPLTNFCVPVGTAGNTQGSGNVHVYDGNGGFGGHIVSPLNPNPDGEVIWTDSGTEYSLIPGACPSSSSSSYSSSQSSSAYSSEDCLCLEFNGERLWACRDNDTIHEDDAYKYVWVYQGVTYTYLVQPSFAGGTWTFYTDNDLDVWGDPDRFAFNSGGCYDWGGVKICACESSSSISESKDCGDLCVKWFDDNYNVRQSTFTGFWDPAAYTDPYLIEQGACVYNGFAGEGRSSVNGGAGASYDIRPNQYGEYQMFNLGGGKTNNAGNMDPQGAYFLDGAAYQAYEGACPSSSSSFSSSDSSSKSSSSESSSSESSSSGSSSSGSSSSESSSSESSSSESSSSESSSSESSSSESSSSGSSSGSSSQSSLSSQSSQSSQSSASSESSESSESQSSQSQSSSYNSYASSESESLGCCNPATITITWSYYDFFNFRTVSHTETLTRGDNCNYYRETPTDCGYYNYYGYSTYEYISVFWNNGFWGAEGGNTCGASVYYGDGTSTDPCSPYGTYTILSLGGYPTGDTWTIS